MSDERKATTVPAAMMSPQTDVVPRRVHSIRRTSHIDMHLGAHGVALGGTARDLVTEADTARVASEATVSAHVDQHGLLTTLHVLPDHGDPERLVGVAVAGGFRKAVHAAYPHDVALGSVVALLLDELPVATLISGYARLYAGQIPANASTTAMKGDICSGWREGGTMMRSVRAGLGVPVTLGPRAPGTMADRELDPLGWHELPPLPHGSMRRRRLVDIAPVDDVWNVTAMFRDTHRESGGDETVLHEYTLTATVDAATGIFLTCAAVPRVLPWVECPVAAASADRLAGQHHRAVRDHVRSELRGTSTCTHLNDLLRSLGDIGPLMTTLTGTIPA
jgi:hypothetical protein